MTLNTRYGLCLVSLLSTSCADGGAEVALKSDAGAEAATGQQEPDGSSQEVACPGPGEAIDPTAVIDDMEDQNSSLAAIAGRSGGWWTAGDDTPGATLVPAPGSPASPELVSNGRCGSQYAMRVTGQGFTDWGSMLGMSFAYDSSGTAFYDAGFREGITFWARIGDTSTNQVRFALSDVNSEPVGGVCTEDGGVEQGCYDTFGVSINSLDTTWKRYKVPFLGLTQRGFGLPAEGVDASKLFSVGFTFEPNAIFDLWIDDISFY